jgi:hypothetical protein
MRNRDELSRSPLNEKLDKGKISNEIPTSQKLMEHDRIPSGFEPMGLIQLEGRAYRSLARGRIPWWVLISGWIILGSIVSLFVFATLPSFSLFSLFPLMIATFPLLILWKGTAAKLSSKKRR